MVGRSRARSCRVPLESTARSATRAHAGALRRQGGAMRSASSSSGTRPAASTTLRLERGTGCCWSAGRCRRACRSRARERHSPCTSRTTRSTTATSRGRSWRASTARHGRDLGPGHLRARRGEEGRRAHGSSPRQPPRGSGRSCPPTSRQGEELAHAAQGPGTEKRDYAPMLATATDVLPVGRAGRSSRSGRVQPGAVDGRRHLPSRNDNDLTSRFAGGRAVGLAVRSPSAVSTARSARR
jgi:hypothetical protein